MTPLLCASQHLDPSRSLKVIAQMHDLAPAHVTEGKLINSGRSECRAGDIETSGPA